MLPKEAQALEKEVPGVGPYTAGLLCIKCLLVNRTEYVLDVGAVSSIAYNQPAALVDGNVIRVVSRLRAIGADTKSKSAVELYW
jgi:A/G-specific adenine glycosylase